MKTKKTGKTMRVAGLLLALVLVTSCFVGGTFAKYVTSGGGTDEARVAKFGVKVTATGDVFAEEYDAKDPKVDGYDGKVIAKSVISSDKTKHEKVVAPGTAKENALTVSVTGTPEVAVKVEYVAHVTFNESLTEPDNWKDKDGHYYCPLVITVNGTAYKGLDYASATEFEDAVEGAINSLTKNYPANTDLSQSGSKGVAISWEWPFEGGEGSKQTDVKDTYLGDQAAAGKAATVGIVVATTVTQID